MNASEVEHELRRILKEGSLTETGGRLFITGIGGASKLEVERIPEIEVVGKRETSEGVMPTPVFFFDLNHKVDDLWSRCSKGCWIAQGTSMREKVGSRLPVKAKT